VKVPVIVLLTSDVALEDVVADALLATGGISHLVRNAGDALKIVCGTGRDLDLGVIDFEHGPHGMTLLKAIDACRKDFPVIVIMHEDQQHVEPLAHANGAVECFSKPVAAKQLAEVFQRCCRTSDPLPLVAY
jgi:DNA-binding NtrC family response regulator